MAKLFGLFDFDPYSGERRSAGRYAADAAMAEGLPAGSYGDTVAGARSAFNMQMAPLVDAQRRAREAAMVRGLGQMAALYLTLRQRQAMTPQMGQAQGYGDGDPLQAPFYNEAAAQGDPLQQFYYSPLIDRLNAMAPQVPQGQQFNNNNRQRRKRRMIVEEED